MLQQGYDGIIQKHGSVDFFKNQEIVRHKFKDYQSHELYDVKGDQIVCFSAIKSLHYLVK